MKGKPETGQVQQLLVQSGEIRNATRPSGYPTNKRERESFLPYIKSITDSISQRLLRKYQVKTIFRPTKNKQQNLMLTKDARDPAVSDRVS